MFYKKMKPWSKQDFFKKEKIPRVNDIIEMAEGITNERNRCLFILTYLTAGRMQELVRYSGKQKRDSIKAEDLIIKHTGERKILLINMRNEKHKTRHRKDIPVPLDIKENIILFNMMTNYLSTINDNIEIFPISYKRAYAIISKLTNWNPHWIRHIRLTHLVTKYNYREHQLMLYAGWSDPRPAKNYLEMRWEDLLYK